MCLPDVTTCDQISQNPQPPPPPPGICILQVINHTNQEYMMTSSLCRYISSTNLTVMLSCTLAQVTQYLKYPELSWGMKRRTASINPIGVPWFPCVTSCSKKCTDNYQSGYTYNREPTFYLDWQESLSLGLWTPLVDCIFGTKVLYYCFPVIH